MRLVIIFCLMIHFVLLGAEKPLVVHLLTEDWLFPTYVGDVKGVETNLSGDYLNDLNKVLQFDLNYNGMTRIVKQTAALSKLSTEDASQWREREIFYVVKPLVRGRVLSAQVLSVYSQTLKDIADIPLTGDLKRDRDQVHQLADAIYKALFGQEGIASTHLLYTMRVQDRSEWFSDVWEVDWDGHNQRQITRNGGYCVTPTYLPPKQGKRSGSFFYVSYKTGQPKIFVASLQDGVGRRLLTLPGNQLMPIASRRRDQIAFISDATGNPDLFLQPFSPESGAIGLPRQIFGAPHATQGTPTFSPDGKRVAFVSDKDGTPRIYIIEIPAVGVPLKKIKSTIVTKYRGATAPAWSPDGTKIAYCANVEGVRQVFVYDLNRDDEAQLTSGAGNKENPSWAPNSLVLAYNTSDPGKSELFLVTLKQPQPVKLSSGPGEKHFPAWESR